tara:strand:+ start:7101 stop:7907 length:807 start_codon:yes stop_codon:yes gene_type:complete
VAKIEDIVLNASQNFANALGISIDQLIDHVLDLKKKGYGPDEIIEILSKVNIENVVFKTAALSAAVDELFSAYPQVLKNMEMTGKVTGSFLSSLELAEKTSIIAYSRGALQEARRRLMYHVLQGSSRERMAYDLYRTGVYSNREVVAHINTTISNYSRAVTLKMSQSDDADRKYHYLGPLDEKTRPICLEMMAAGEVSLGEIDSLYPGSLSDGGGWNCRHRWSPVTSVSKPEQKAEKAANRKAAMVRKKKWPSRVETLREYQERVLNV